MADERVGATLGADFADLLALFRDEAADLLGTLEQALLSLTPGSPNRAGVDAVFRVVHTLKGSAATLGLTPVVQKAHALEESLQHLRSGDAWLDEALSDELFEFVDDLRALIASELSAARSGSGAQPPAQGRGTLRVAVEKLDRIVTLVGEITVARVRLGEALERGAGSALDLHRDMDHLYRELQGEILKTRAVPIGPFFRQHLRTIRDLASSVGKDVLLRLEGEAVEVDTAVIEAIRDPVNHMVRNAIAHGIESGDVRAQRGKARRGTIVLRARHESGTVVVEISDDGGGFALDKLRTLARGRTPGTAGENLSDDALLDLAFSPGVSTAESVTDLSGRGVGLDVVRRNVEALHGSVAVESHPGQGTTIRLRLPLTLAIIEGLYVSAGGETYVVPMDCVTECLDLPASQGSQARCDGTINLRGAVLPYVRLRSQLAIVAPPPARESLIVVRTPAGAAGIVVDALQGTSEVVIKPLAKTMRRTSAIAGSSILPSGKVALILEVGALFRDKPALTLAGEHPC